MNKPKRDILLIALAVMLVLFSILDFPEIYSKAMNGEAVIRNIIVEVLMLIVACFLFYRGLYPVSKS